MQSNIVEFLKTRKFWSGIIALLMTFVTYAVPKYLNIEITPDVQNMITAFMWSIAAIVVYGDAKYDWINAEKTPAPVASTQSGDVNVSVLAKPGNELPLAG